MKGKGSIIKEKKGGRRGREMKDRNEGELQER